ncbi:hypothetical protein [Phocaeicola faecalis]
MKVIYNRFIPFNGFKSINLFGVLFVRDGYTMKDADFNHEAIHTAQMKEMLYVFFYIAYLLEWFYHLIRLRKWMEAYHSISLEKEAYGNQYDYGYLKHRKHYSQYKS